MVSFLLVGCLIRWAHFQGIPGLSLQANQGSASLAAELHSKTEIGHKAGVVGLAFNNDGTKLFSSAEDGRVIEWQSNPKNSNWHSRLLSKGVQGSSFAVSREGNITLAGGLDLEDEFRNDELEPVNCPYFKHIDATKFRQSLNKIALSPDGRRLALADTYGVVEIIDNLHQSIHMQCKLHDCVGAIAFSPDGNMLAAASSSEIRIIDTDTGSKIKSFNVDEEFRSLTFSPNGKYLAAGSVGGILDVWDLAAGKQMKPLSGFWFDRDSRVPTSSRDGEFTSMVFSQDNDWLVAANEYHSVHVWNLKTGVCLRTLDAPGSKPTCLAFDPCRKILASGYDDGSICIWSFDAGKLMSKLHSEPYAVQSIDWSADGKMIALADYGIKLYDATTGKLLRRLCTSRTWKYNKVVFSPTRTIVAGWSSDFNGYITLWDARTGAVFAHWDNVRTRPLVFSPDGKFLVTSDDSSISIWDVDQCISNNKTKPTKNAKPASQILPDSKDQYSIAIAPDGKTLASCSFRTVTLWNVVSKTKFHSWTYSQDPFKNSAYDRRTYENARYSPQACLVKYSHDGTKLACLADTPTAAHLWNIQSQEELPSIITRTSSVACFDSDNNIIVTADIGKHLVKIVEPASGKNLALLENLAIKERTVFQPKKFNH